MLPTKKADARLLSAESLKRRFQSRAEQAGFQKVLVLADFPQVTFGFALQNAQVIDVVVGQAVVFG